MESRIVYPSNIKTDQDRLFGLYNLMEKFRLTHNEFGELARSDWERYGGKWPAFQHRFSQLRAPVTAEIIILRDNIRKAHPKEVWLPTDTPSTLRAIALFGDKNVLRNIDNGITVPGLETLKALELDKLAEVPDPPYENWLTYTEVDTGGYLTVAANQITITNMIRGCDSRVYFDKGAGHFPLIFTYYVDNQFLGANDNDPWYAVWALSGVMPYAAPYFEVANRRSNGAHVYGFFMDDGGADSDLSGAIADGGIEYLTLDRNAVDFDTMLYSDAARTVLIDTMTVNKGVSTLRYIQHAFPNAGAGDQISGEIYNSDLGEGAAPFPGNAHLIQMMAGR